jgi:diaminopimelate epimerase
MKLLMKKIEFVKMAGAGNDFIMIDTPKKGFNLKAFTKKVCDRTNGVGADGVIVCDKSKESDYKMRIINADGSEAEMCGNGARCLASYIVATKKPKKKLFTVETLAGELLAESKDEIAHVRLSEPTDHKIDVTLKINKRSIKAQYIDTGVPHAIIFVEDVEQIDVKALGSLVRFHKAFKPRGTNANFVSFEKKGLVSVRTYERGVEDETKACGTGSVAAGILGYLHCNPDVQNKKNAKMRVRTRGGEILQVTFDIVDGTMTNVWLKGSAKIICEGKYYIK